jgi:hypothetical protein
MWHYYKFENIFYRYSLLVRVRVGEVEQAAGGGGANHKGGNETGGGRFF